MGDEVNRMKAVAMAFTAGFTYLSGCLNDTSGAVADAINDDYLDMKLKLNGDPLEGVEVELEYHEKGPFGIDLLSYDKERIETTDESGGLQLGDYHPDGQVKVTAEYRGQEIERVLDPNERDVEWDIAGELEPEENVSVPGNLQADNVTNYAEA